MSCRSLLDKVRAEPKLFVASDPFLSFSVIFSTYCKHFALFQSYSFLLSFIFFCFAFTILGPICTYGSWMDGYRYICRIYTHTIHTHICMSVYSSDLCPKGRIKILHNEVRKQRGFYKPFKKWEGSKIPPKRKVTSAQIEAPQRKWEKMPNKISRHYVARSQRQPHLKQVRAESVPPHQGNLKLNRFCLSKSTVTPTFQSLYLWTIPIFTREVWGWRCLEMHLLYSRIDVAFGLVGGSLKYLRQNVYVAE